MKPFFLAGCLLAGCFSIFAQSVNEDVNFKLMLFEHFTPSKVFFKDGKLAIADLNYNTFKHQLIFIEDKQYKELVGLETIDSIIIDVQKYIPVTTESKQSKDSIVTEPTKFIPIEGKIFQCTGNKELFILYSYSVSSSEVTSNHFGSHKEEVKKIENTVTGVYDSRNYRSFKNFNTVKEFWVQEKKDFIEVRQVKQLAKAFNVEKNTLTSYISQNHTDFGNEEDVNKLLTFLKKK